MKKLFQKEDGLTLVEILAAITILGIIFIGFLSIFPRMTEINFQTETKLETMNLARAELVELKEDGKSLLENRASSKVVAEVELNEETKSIERYSYQSRSDYRYEVDYYQDEDISKNTSEQSIQLNKIHIKVYDGDKVISEIFGYLEQ